MINTVHSLATDNDTGLSTSYLSSNCLAPSLSIEFKISEMMTLTRQAKNFTENIWRMNRGSEGEPKD